MSASPSVKNSKNEHIKSLQLSLVVPISEAISQNGIPSTLAGMTTGYLALCPGLCRAARGALEWTQEGLADEARVSRSTIRDYEGNKHGIQRSTAAQICLAFERHGLVLMNLPGIGFGVWKLDTTAQTDEIGFVQAF